MSYNPPARSKYPPNNTERYFQLNEKDRVKQTCTNFSRPVYTASLSSSNSRTSSNISQKSLIPEAAPRKLTRDYFELIVSALTLLLPIPFFVLAFYAAHVDRKDIDEEQWQDVQNYMKLSVTAFPILFAATAGRAIKKLASWQLEQGARIGHLEQLLGSTSLGGTIASILSLRLCNILAPALLLIWAISPLGGQSSLHLVTIGSRDIVSNVNITYYDTRSESVFAQGSQAAGIFLPTTDAVFQAAIMEPSSAKGSTRDLWSNVRIPTVESTPENMTYASLLGIPLTGLPTTGTTKLTLESSYLTLTPDNSIGNISNLAGFSNTVNATSIDNMTNGTWHWAFPTPNFGGLLLAIDGFNQGDGGFGIDYDIYNHFTPEDPSTQTQQLPQPRRIALTSTNFAYQRFYTLSTTYVSTDITCSPSSPSISFKTPPQCTALTSRLSTHPHLPNSLTNLALPATWSLFATSLTASVALTPQGQPTITEAYLNDPASVAAASVTFNAGSSKSEGGSTGNGAYKLTADDVAVRLRAQHLLNAYWQASVNPAVLIAGLDAVAATTPSSSAASSSSSLRTTTAPATHTLTVPVYHLERGWWAAFVLASMVMLGLAAVNVGVDVVLCGPEVLGSVVSALKCGESGSSSSSSALGSMERARRWRDVRVGLVDARAGEEVGVLEVRVVGFGRGNGGTVVQDGTRRRVGGVSEKRERSVERDWCGPRRGGRLYA